MAMNKQQAGLLGSAGLGAGLGAGLMYLLDPQAGKGRRTVAKDKTVSALKQGKSAVGKKSRHLGNRGKGLVLGAASKLRKGHADDQELQQEAEGAAELKGNGASASFVRKAWAPALCTAATAGLAWAGFKNRDKLGSALSTALFLRDLGRRPAALQEAEAESDSGRIELKKTLHVNAPVDQVFELWSNFEGFPRFMNNVMEVTDLGQGRSRWVVKGPAGTRVQWTAEVTRVEPGKLLSWQSEPGAVVENNGTVRFERVGESTRVDVLLCYAPPGGTVGRGVAFFLGEDPKAQMDEDLARFKALLEGEETSGLAAEVEASDYVPAHS